MGKLKRAGIGTNLIEFLPITAKSRIEMSRSRKYFKYFLDIQLRFNDNDVYGHVNNYIYYSFFDTVVNHFLVHRGNLHCNKSQDIGLVVTSSCNYFAPLTYPGKIEAGLCISKIGKSSLTYEIGIFDENKQLCAAGNFVHVFVNEGTRRPSSIPDAIRKASETILTEDYPGDNRSLAKL